MSDAAATKRYFLSKLIPPRPSFGLDMTDAERAVMQRHVAYWTGLLDQGRAILFGPVGDPKGPYGIGILVGRDEDDVKALGDCDPAILAGIGLRYEIYPMLNLVMKS